MNNLFIRRKYIKLTGNWLLSPEEAAEFLLLDKQNLNSYLPHEFSSLLVLLWLLWCSLFLSSSREVSVLYNSDYE